MNPGSITHEGSTAFFHPDDERFFYMMIGFFLITYMMTPYF